MRKNTGVNEGRITGDDILSEILRNAELGIFRIRRTALVPCVYSIYLHPDDFEPLRPVLRHIRGEIREALAETLAQWNRGSQAGRLSKYLPGLAADNAVHRILERDWTVDIFPDTENRLSPGDIEVYSELGSGADQEQAAGSMTALITRTGESGQTSRRMEPRSSEPRTVYARIHFQVNGTSDVFEMRQDEIAIGRGGPSFWVDIKLPGPQDISREHCRIRREPGTGRFYLKDMSQFGTTVNGKAAPPQPAEIEVPDGASLRLAGVMDLTFQVVKP